MSLKNLLKLQGAKPPAAADEPVVAAPAKPTMPAGLKGLPLMGAPKPEPKPEAAAPAAPTPKVESLELAGLASLDLSSIGSQEPETESYVIPMFEDLIDAKAPERSFPEELTSQQKGFVNLLDSIYDIVLEPELFGQAVRTIMSELQSNQEYSKLVGDSDVNTLIRGMRQTMGLARVRKAEKATKRTTSSKKSKTPTFDLGLDLAGLGI